MEYQQFIEKAQSLDFIEGQEMADAAVKAVLGILTSRLDEPHARKLAGELPEPLTYEKLRGIQRNVTRISADQYFSELSTQFKLSEDQSRMLVKTILHLTKDAVSDDTLSQVKEDLPSDWVETLENA